MVGIARPDFTKCNRQEERFGMEKASWWEPLVINIVFAVFYLLCFQVKFETNDDEAMMQIVSGMYGAYEPHMVFINVVIGFFLAFLYRLNIGIQWYPVLMIILLYISFSVISLLLYKRNRNIGRIISFCILMTFGYYFYTTLQFTEIAGILSSAGLLLLWDSWKYCNQQTRAKTLANIIAGSVLLIIGSLYRFHCAILILAVSILYVAANVEKYEWLKTIKFLGIIIAVSLICLCFYKMDQSFYKTEEWKYYTEYNAYRADVMDYNVPEYADNQSIYRKLNIDEQDISFLKKWNINDANIYGLKTMKTLSNLNEKFINKDNFVQNFARQMFNGVINYSWIWGYILSVCIVLFLCEKRTTIRLLFLQIVGLIIVEMYFFASGRYLQSRVDIGVFLIVTVINYMLAIEYRHKGYKKNIKHLYLAAAIVLLISISRMEVYTEEVGYTEEFENIIADKTHLYILPTLGVDVGKIDIWKVLPCGALSNIVSTGGWTTFAPFNNEILRKYEVDNIFENSVNNEKVYFVSSKTDEQINDFVQFINRHYDKKAYAVLIKAGETMNVYKVESR